MIHIKEKLIKTEAEILFEWNKPQEIVGYEAQNSLRRWRRIIPITIVVAFLIEVCLLIPIILILKKCGPEYEDMIPSFLKLFLLAILVITVLPIVFIALDQISYKLSKTSYQITQDMLITPSDKIPQIPWKQAMYIGVMSHEKVVGCQYLKIFYKKRTRLIPLPKSHLTDEIIKYVSKNSKIKKDDSLLEPIVITQKQKTFILCLIGTYILLSFCIAFFLISPFISKQAAGFFLLIWFYVILFVGPGTASMLIFYRPLYFRRVDLHQKAMGYNLITSFIILSIGALWFLRSIFVEILNSLK